VPEVHVARERVAGGPQGRQQPVEGLALPAQVGEPAATLQDLDLALEDVDRGRQLCLETTRAVRAHEGVGVLALRQGDDLHRCALPEKLVAGSERRLQAGLVRVVQQIDVARVSPDELRLILGEGGAHRCDGRFDSRADEAQDIEVSLDHEHALVAPRRLLGPVEPIEQTALAEDRRLRRVEVLGLPRAEQPATEADDAVR
jgi:hypothetical protein